MSRTSSALAIVCFFAVPSLAVPKIVVPGTVVGLVAVVVVVVPTPWIDG